jgi:superfamily II DNA or RNA helicase
VIYDIDNEINLDIIDNETRAKCIFLYKCLVEKGAKKCIIYCQDTNKLQSMINMMLELNSYYYLDFDINSITSSTSYKKREKILN